VHVRAHVASARAPSSHRYTHAVSIIGASSKSVNARGWFASFFRDRTKIVQCRNNSNEVSDIATQLPRLLARIERFAELPRVLQRQTDVVFLRRATSRLHNKRLTAG